MILQTPDDVLKAVGPLGPEYEDIIRYTDGTAGFSVKRRYPETNELGEIRMRGGRRAVVCLLRLVVTAPSAAGGVSGVELSASPFRVWSDGWIGRDPADHPETVTPDAANRLRRARIPVALNFNDEYVWDSADDRF